MGMMDGNGNPICHDFHTRTDFAAARTTSLSAIFAEPDLLSHSLNLSCEWPVGKGFSVIAKCQYVYYTHYQNADGNAQSLPYLLGADWSYQAQAFPLVRAGLCGYHGPP